MFTIEHEYDASVITLIDEGEAPLNEDVVIVSHDDGISISQVDPDTDDLMVVTLSMRQIEELRVALNLPEGVYRLPQKG